MIRRLLPLGLLLAVAAPALAQKTDSHTFLDAVKEAKGDDVTHMVETPGSRIVNTHDYDTGETALHIVVRRNDLTYIAYLIAHGADPNLTDFKGTTPLMLAVTLGQADAAARLLAGHANPNLANKSGETPLIRAVQQRDLPMVRLLVTAGADPSQRDVIAGLSAREYAQRDTRTPALLKVLDEKPETNTTAVAGPKL